MIQELIEVVLPEVGVQGPAGWRARGSGDGCQAAAGGPGTPTYPRPPGGAAPAPAAGPGPRAGPAGAGGSCPLGGREHVTWLRGHLTWGWAGLCPGRPSLRSSGWRSRASPPALRLPGSHCVTMEMVALGTREAGRAQGPGAGTGPGAQPPVSRPPVPRARPPHASPLVTQHGLPRSRCQVGASPAHTWARGDSPAVPAARGAPASQPQGDDLGQAPLQAGPWGGCQGGGMGSNWLIGMKFLFGIMKYFGSR